MPREASRTNREAWAAWAVLNEFGRDLDIMAGNVMPLRLEAVQAECGRYADPDAVRWRVLQIERKILAGRRQAQARKNKD